MQQPDDKPFRRIVFYVSGYDPRGVLFLHKNCATETARWSETTGIPVTMGPRKSIGKLARTWPIVAEFPDRRVETRFDFMQWDDIIREHWERRVWLVYLQALWDFMLFWRWGVMQHAIRNSWPIAITIAAPSVIAILNALSVLMFVGALAIIISGPGLFGIVASAVLILLAGAAFLYARTAGPRFRPDWNARIAHFGATLARNQVPALHARIDEFIDHILAVIDAEKPDEALILSHSYGTAVASILGARLLERRPDLGKPGSPLAMVTLGQAQNMIPQMKPAGWLRDELRLYSKHPDFNWVDFSAPPDGACYVMTSILDGLGAPDGMPKMLNAQFHKSFSKKRMDEARRERFVMHFFYLMAPDQPEINSDLYDFILLIAGPQSVSDRYGRRKSQNGYFKRKPRE